LRSKLKHAIHECKEPGQPNESGEEQNKYGYKIEMTRTGSKSAGASQIQRGGKKSLEKKKRDEEREERFLKAREKLHRAKQSGN